MLFANIIGILFIFVVIALSFEPTFCPLYRHRFATYHHAVWLPELVNYVWLSNVTSTSWMTAVNMVHRGFVATLGPLLYFNFMHDY